MVRSALYLRAYVYPCKICTHTDTKFTSARNKSAWVRNNAIIKTANVEDTYFMNKVVQMLRCLKTHI